jgi:type II secretion system protein G
MRTTKGFTLIELLIVVAIIAILAAIAVPNFLEAQVRSKVSRTLADMRTMRTGLESYYVDNNRYPETDQGIVAANNAASPRRAQIRLTTPIAYITSLPSSPWKEIYGSPDPVNDPKIATRLVSYLYIRRFLTDPAVTDPNWIGDRRAYVTQASSNSNPRHVTGEWQMKSVGPDNVDNIQTEGAANARLYDPTNGTVSNGDIVIFNDFNGSLK